MVSSVCGLRETVTDWGLVCMNACIRMSCAFCVYVCDDVIDGLKCSLKQKEVVEKLIGYIVDDDGEKGSPEPTTSTETTESSSGATASASETEVATETTSADESGSADTTPSDSSGDDDATSSGGQDTSRRFKYVSYMRACVYVCMYVCMYVCVCVCVCVCLLMRENGVREKENEGRRGFIALHAWERISAFHPFDRLGVRLYCMISI